MLTLIAGWIKNNNKMFATLSAPERVHSYTGTHATCCCLSLSFGTRKRAHKNEHRVLTYTNAHKDVRQAATNSFHRNGRQWSSSATVYSCLGCCLPCFLSFPLQNAARAQPWHTYTRTRVAQIKRSLKVFYFGLLVVWVIFWNSPWNSATFFNILNWIFKKLFWLK